MSDKKPLAVWRLALSILSVILGHKLRALTINLEIDHASSRDNDGFAILDIRFENRLHDSTSCFIVESSKAGSFDEIEFFRFTAGIDQDAKLHRAFFAQTF